MLFSIANKGNKHMETQRDVDLRPAKMDPRKVALARYLKINVEDISSESRGYDNRAYMIGNAEYLVLTDREATMRAAAYIKDSLWAFNSEFILGVLSLGLSDHDTELLRAALGKMQGELCESANPLIAALLRGKLPQFIKKAIAADGRGHFLAGYDFNEGEQGEYFIYRTN